jgi:caa(3)-type oxidase subunit IV
MSESHPVDFKSYVRTCTWVFVAVFLTTASMIAVSFTSLGWSAKVALILAIAIVNAFLVASYLMHLLSEKKMVYTLLAFTVFFFTGLMALTVWAMNDFPTGTMNH